MIFNKTSFQDNKNRISQSSTLDIPDIFFTRPPLLLNPE